MKHQEHIVAIRQSMVEAMGIEQGLYSRTMLPLHLFCDRVKSQTVIAQRAGLEDDPTHRQLVTYVVFYKEAVGGNSRQFAVYQRRVGDARLLGDYSVGFGGHVELTDVQCHSDDLLDLEKTLNTALVRELSEEVGLQSDVLEHATHYGYINDMTDPVGRVHLGVVYAIRLDADQDIRPNEQGLQWVGWRTAAEMRALKLERWSQLLTEIMGY